MLNSHERQVLIQLQDNGTELSPEDKRMLMKADEADFDRLTDLIHDLDNYAIGEDDEQIQHDNISHRYE